MSKTDKICFWFSVVFLLACIVGKGALLLFWPLPAHAHQSNLNAYEVVGALAGAAFITRSFWRAATWYEQRRTPRVH